jgi:two-component system LytT family response regulator
METPHQFGPLPPGTIIVTERGIKKIIALNLILRFEADGAYTTIYTKTKKKITASQNLACFELQTNGYFVRTHRSHLVNLYEIIEYHRYGRGGRILLSDNTMVEVSQREKSEFIRTLEAFAKNSKQLVH